MRKPSLLPVLFFNFCYTLWKKIIYFVVCNRKKKKNQRERNKLVFEITLLNDWVKIGSHTLLDVFGRVFADTVST